MHDPAGEQCKCTRADQRAVDHSKHRAPVPADVSAACCVECDAQVDQYEGGEQVDRAQACDQIDFVNPEAADRNEGHQATPKVSKGFVCASAARQAENRKCERKKRQGRKRVGLYCDGCVQKWCEHEFGSLWTGWHLGAP